MRRNILSLIVGMAVLILTLTACTGKQGDDKRSVASYLPAEIKTAEVESFEVVDQTSGYRVVIDDQEVIQEVLQSLDNITIVEDLGTRGYAFGGYSILIPYKQNQQDEVFRFQLDQSYTDEEKGFYISSVGDHFYEVDGEDIAAYFDPYFD